MMKKRNHTEAERFAEKIKEIQSKAKTALIKAQKDIKRYANKKRGEGEEYQIDDLVIPSTKDLK